MNKYAIGAGVVLLFSVLGSAFADDNKLDPTELYFIEGAFSKDQKALKCPGNSREDHSKAIGSLRRVLPESKSATDEKAVVVDLKSLKDLKLDFTKLNENVDELGIRCDASGNSCSIHFLVVGKSGLKTDGECVRKADVVIRGALAEALFGRLPDDKARDAERGGLVFGCKKEPSGQYKCDLKGAAFARFGLDEITESDENKKLLQSFVGLDPSSTDTNLSN